MSDILHAVIDAQTSDESHFDTVVKSADLSEEAGAAIKGAMKILNAYSDMIPAEQALAVVSEGLGVKKASDPEEEDEDEDETKKAEEKEEDEEEVKELSEMVTESEKATEFEEGEESEGEKLSDEEEDDEEEEDAKKGNSKSLQKSLKALDPAVRNQVTALWKSQKEAVAKANRLEKSLAKERDERLRKEFISKAQNEFRFVPGKSPEELGLMLKSLHGLDSQIAKDIEGIFKSVSAMVEKGDLLDELGSSMSGEVGSGSAYSKLDNIAKSRVAKSDESYAKAFEAAMKSHPELYTAYLNEQAK